MKDRLDKTMVSLGLVRTRSQAESYIKLSQVKVNGQTVTKPGFLVAEEADITLSATEQYVSRAGLKLASVVQGFDLNFINKTMLDVGSSTGGFTDYALQHRAAKVVAVEVGSNQLHPSLQGDPRIELHEQTDIRDFQTDQQFDIVVIDVSFISLRDILPAVKRLSNKKTDIIAMAKPQFEASSAGQKHKGVIKNDKMRREILKSFEDWLTLHKFAVVNKADSGVAGEKGNLERFYHLAIDS